MKTNQLLSYYQNPRAHIDNEYTEKMRRIISTEYADEAEIDLQMWPGYKPTRLLTLSGLARKCGIEQIYYKDESQRFGLKSFKALGGAYAVAQQLLKHIKKTESDTVTIADLFSGKYKARVAEVTIITATDGNHGRSVAWGAQMFGCRCVIYIHADVSAGREKSMSELGAKVIRIAGNYDDSIKEVDRVSKENGWTIVSDNSYPGYVDIPKDVMRGYSVMLKETVTQLKMIESDIPTHIFIQGGCGGLAAAVCGYFWDLWGKDRPRIVIVEPEQANCLQLSAKNPSGEPVVVDGKLETLMAGLACGEVSLLAWEILQTGCDDFTTVNESLVPMAMKILAKGESGDVPVEAGESAVPGIAALLATINNQSIRDNLGLSPASRVLIFGTEGATDLEVYQQLIAS